MVTVDELKEMLISVSEFKDMLKNIIKTVTLEEFVKGQSYNLPNFGDSVEVINAKLEQLSKSLVDNKVQLEFNSYKNLFESIKDLVNDSATYKVVQIFIDPSGKKYCEIPKNFDSPVALFKIEIVRR